MTTEAKIQLTSNELGRLWMTYQIRTALSVLDRQTDVLIQSDIQPPSTWAGKATTSIQPGFSDKLMMFIVNLISGFAIGNNSLGTSFSMRRFVTCIYRNIQRTISSF